MSVVPDKKSIAKFTIQFSRKDPAHIQVTEILNRQGRGDKAQYIVDAVLHYVNSGGAREAQLPRSALVDETQVEVIVNRILQDKQIHGGGGSSAPSPVATAPTSLSSAGNSSAHQGQPDDGIDMDSETELGEEAVGAVANAMEGFRRR